MLIHHFILLHLQVIKQFFDHDSAVNEEEGVKGEIDRAFHYMEPNVPNPEVVAVVHVPVLEPVLELQDRHRGHDY